MGSPYHIDGTTSRLFPNRTSAQYEALSHITKSFAHPQRTFLAVFIQKAVNPEHAARFFLEQAVGKDQVAMSEFLADWTVLVRKLQPLLCNMRNVLIDENGRISGIVDWECAGWYPEYWEYTKMHFGARFAARWIADVIDQVFLGYREELRAEDILAASTPPW